MTRSLPTSPQKRLASLDALRGLAMLGIMLVNFPTMNTMAGEETTAYGGVSTAFDGLMQSFNMALLNGKFYPIFALLFGLGMYIFMSNAQKRGQNPEWLMVRRLLILLGIGALHLTLVWWGDILIMYSLLGLLALWSFRLSPRLLVLLAVVFLVGVPGLTPVLTALGVNLERTVTSGLGLNLVGAPEAARVYVGGSFAEMLNQRYLDFISDYTPFAEETVSLGTLLEYACYHFQLLGLFLLGLAAGKTSAHRWVVENVRASRILWVAATAGACAVTAVRYAVPGLFEPLYYFQGEIVAFFYIISLVLIHRRFGANGLLKPFEAVGRMSLTAYLSHTIFASLLLYGTGLGLYGKVGPGVLVPVGLGFYMLVAWGCAVWARHFRFGPVEWVWRSLLYGRFQPLRIGGQESGEPAANAVP